MTGLLTMADLAARFRYSKRTIQKIVEREDFPKALRLYSPTSWPRWREADILAWEKKHQREAARVAS